MHCGPHHRVDHDGAQYKRLEPRRRRNGLAASSNGVGGRSAIFSRLLVGPPPPLHIASPSGVLIATLVVVLLLLLLLRNHLRVRVTDDSDYQIQHQKRTYEQKRDKVDLNRTFGVLQRVHDTCPAFQGAYLKQRDHGEPEAVKRHEVVPVLEPNGLPCPFHRLFTSRAVTAYRAVLHARKIFRPINLPPIHHFAQVLTRRGQGSAIDALVALVGNHRQGVRLLSTRQAPRRRTLRCAVLVSVLHLARVEGIVVSAVPAQRTPKHLHPHNRVDAKKESQQLDDVLHPAFGQR
eukprot:COSAG04_NODE_1940_length_5169_cov_7.771006_2_plen_291_part_00